jgi:hypothetical protein
VKQLNAMVGELIKENRKLRRQVEKVAGRAGKSAAVKTVERALRAVSRRVEKALGEPQPRRRKAPPANGRKRKTTTTRKPKV